MKIRQFLPILHIYIELPLIMIRTQLMAEQLDTLYRQYVLLEIHVWNWSVQFRLYDTDKRIYERRKKEAPCEP